MGLRAVLERDRSMAGGIGEAQTAIQTLVKLLPCLFANSKGREGAEDCIDPPELRHWA